MEHWILLVMFVAGGKVHYIETPNRDACYRAGAEIQQKQQPYVWDCSSKKAMDSLHDYYMRQQQAKK